MPAQPNEPRGVPAPAARALLLRAAWVALALALLALPGGPLAPTAAAAATIVVTTLDDELNADGDCALREAVRAANLDAAVDACPAGSGADTITLPSGIYLLTVAGAGEEAAATGDLDVVSGSTVTIDGVGAGSTFVEACDIDHIDRTCAAATGTGIADRVFHVLAGGTLTLSDLTVRRGLEDGGGAGVHNSGTLTVTNSTFSLNGSNTVGGLTGGAIRSDGTLTVRDSILSDNVGDVGGGLGVSGGTALVSRTTITDNSSGGGVGVTAGTLTIVNSTLTNNEESNGGGIRVYGGAASLVNTTVSGNQASDSGGGVVDTGAGTLTLTNTIVANNTAANAAPDCLGTIISGGHNLIEDATGCTINGDPTGNITGADPNLQTALTNNGGANRTLAPNAGSNVIDVGHAATCADATVGGIDQRGVARPQGADCDIGAVELGGEPSAYTIDTTADDVDMSAGDGICATAGNNCTLRAAIEEANALAGTQTLTLPSGTYTLTVAGPDEDAAATGDLDVTSTIALVGAGASGTEVDGGALDRVFHVTGSLDARDLSIMGGDTTGAGDVDGGGLYVDGGTLALTRAIVRNNTADLGSLGGGGITANGGTVTLADSTVRDNTAPTGGGVSLGSATLDATGSTFSGNSAPLFGGAFLVVDATVRVTNSTVAGNTAGFDGGGVYLVGANPALVLASSTVYENTATGGTGGGIFVDSGSATLRNTILAGNTGGGGAPDCAGNAVTSDGYNILGDDTGCTFNAATGDQVGTGASPIDPQLAALAPNGGATETRAAGAGTPAIDAGNPAGCTDAAAVPAAITTDQRGMARGRCDVGAFELPEVRVADVSQDEGHSGATAFAFTVSLPGSLPIGAPDTTVSWATSDGTAMAGSDYTAVGATVLTYRAGGAASQSATVLASGDTTTEADETFAVDLSAAGDAVIETAQAFGTIRNDDGVSAPPPSTAPVENSQPTLSGPASVAVAAGGTATFTLTVGDRESGPTGLTLGWSAEPAGRVQSLTLGAAQPDGSVAVTLVAAGVAGDATLTFRVTDNRGASYALPVALQITTPTPTPTPPPTATPPADGGPTGPRVAPLPLSTLPAGIAPLDPATGGVAVLVPPAAGGAYAPISAGAGSPAPATLWVPAPSPGAGGGIGVRLQPRAPSLDGVNLPAGAVVVALAEVEIDVFDVSTGVRRTRHDPPLVLALELPADARALCATAPTRIALVRVTGAGGVVRLAPASLDCATGLLIAELRETSSFAAVAMPSPLTIPFRTALPLLPED